MSEPISLAEPLVLYAVRNHAGKWFRSKGQHGYGQQWRDSIQEAKFYGKVGPARGVAGYYRNTYKTMPPPEVVRVIADRIEAVADQVKPKPSLPKFTKCVPVWGKLKRNFVSVILFFGKTELEVLLDGSVSRNGRFVEELSDSFLAEAAQFVAAILDDGAPPEPFADWIREHYAEILEGTK